MSDATPIKVPETPEELLKTEHFKDFLGWLPKELGVPPDFIDRIERRDDDWTFVIKLHALVEAALNHAITVTLNRPELSEIIGHLDAGNRQTGKVAFVKDLDLLSEAERCFIYMFSKLRNDLVHKVKNVEFTFSSHISKMQSAQRKNFFEVVSAGVTDTVKLGSKTMTGLEFCMKFPRQAILANTMGILLRVHLCHERAAGARVTEELAMLHLKTARLIEQLPESSPTE